MITPTLADWLGSSAIGIFLGLVLAWFWINTSISRCKEYYDRTGPRWFFIFGTPKEGWTSAPGPYDGLPRIISVIGLVGFLLMYHINYVKPALDQGFMIMVWTETGLPLSLALTWFLLVFTAEKSISKYRPNGETTRSLNG